MASSTFLLLHISCRGTECSGWQLSLTHTETNLGWYLRLTAQDEARTPPDQIRNREGLIRSPVMMCCSDAAAGISPAAASLPSDPSPSASASCPGLQILLCLPSLLLHQVSCSTLAHMRSSSIYRLHGSYMKSPSLGIEQHTFMRQEHLYSSKGICDVPSCRHVQTIHKCKNSDPESMLQGTLRFIETGCHHSQEV